MTQTYHIHYSPFGSSLPNRTWSDVSRGYRYGFNGQDKDNEVSGEGNSYSAEFWQYDSRLGRRFNLDPILKPNASGYYCLSNRPIINVDPDGALDYYNRKGKWIGTDGIDDSKKSVAHSRKARNEIKRNTRIGSYTNSQGLVGNGVVVLPDAETKNAINNSLKNTRENTGRYKESDANRHEEGGFTDEKGPHEAFPGEGIGHDPTLTGEVGTAGATVVTRNAKDGTVFKAENVKFEWHTHPDVEEIDTENPSPDLGRGIGDLPMAASHPILLKF